MRIMFWVIFNIVALVIVALFIRNTYSARIGVPNDYIAGLTYIVSLTASIVVSRVLLKLTSTARVVLGVLFVSVIFLFTTVILMWYYLGSAVNSIERGNIMLITAPAYTIATAFLALCLAGAMILLGKRG